MNKSEDIIKKIEALMVDKHFKDALKLQFLLLYFRVCSFNTIVI